MIGSFAFETHVSLVSFYARNVTFITCMRCVAISSITYEKLCKHLKAKSVFYVKLTCSALPRIVKWRPCLESMAE